MAAPLDKSQPPQNSQKNPQPENEPDVKIILDLTGDKGRILSDRASEGSMMIVEDVIDPLASTQPMDTGRTEATQIMGKTDKSMIVLDLSSEKVQIVKEKGGVESKDKSESSMMILESDKDLIEDDKTPEIPGYNMVKRLGKGAMGTVYKAIQVSMDRPVAIKILARSLARDQQFVHRFIAEAKTVAKLNHENVVSGIDVGKAGDDVYYFVMEFVDGKPVSNLLQDGATIPIRQALEITLQTARALEHAQRHGIIHRDVKPENIMLTAAGIAKLCDLGLARKEGEDSGLTMAGAAVGTPQYISPEQAKGLKEIDSRSDIYSLGASLYHMVTGTVPYPNQNPVVVCALHVTQPFPDPKLKNSEIPDEVCKIIKKCTEKKPEDRYQRPTDLIVDLKKLIIAIHKSGRMPKVVEPVESDQERTVRLPERPALPSADNATGTLVDNLKLVPVAEEKKAREDIPPTLTDSTIPLAFTDEAYPTTKSTSTSTSLAQSHTGISKKSSTQRALEKQRQEQAAKKKEHRLSLMGGMVAILVVVGSLGYLAYPWLDSKFNPVPDKKTIHPINTGKNDHPPVLGTQEKEVERALALLQATTYDPYDVNSISNRLARYTELETQYAASDLGRSMIQKACQQFSDKIEEAAMAQYGKSKKEQDLLRAEYQQTQDPMKLRQIYDLLEQFPPGFRTTTHAGKKVVAELAQASEQIMALLQQETKAIQTILEKAQYREALAMYKKMMAYCIPAQKDSLATLKDRVKQDYVQAIQQARQKYAKEIMPLHQALREDDWAKAKVLYQSYEQNQQYYAIAEIMDDLWRDMHFVEKTWNILQTARTKNDIPSPTQIEAVFLNLEQANELPVPSRDWVLGILYLKYRHWRDAKNHMERVTEELAGKEVYLEKIMREINEESAGDKFKKVQAALAAQKFSRARQLLASLSKELAQTAFVQSRQKEIAQLEATAAHGYLQKYATELFFQGKFLRQPLEKENFAFQIAYPLQSVKELQDFYVGQGNSDIQESPDGLKLQMREANTLCEFYWKAELEAIDQVQIKLGTGDTGMANIGLALHKQEPIAEWKNLQRYLCLIHFDPHQMCRSEIYSKAPEYKNHSQYQKILTGKANYTGIQAAICWTEGNAGALPKRILEIAKAQKEVVLADTAWSLTGKMKGNVLQFSVQSGSGKVQLETKCDRFTKGFVGFYTNSPVTLGEFQISGRFQAKWFHKIVKEVMGKDRDKYLKMPYVSEE